MLDLSAGQDLTPNLDGITVKLPYMTQMLFYHILRGSL